MRTSPIMQMDTMNMARSKLFSFLFHMPSYFVVFNLRIFIFLYFSCVNFSPVVLQEEKESKQEPQSRLKEEEKPQQKQRQEEEQEKEQEQREKTQPQQGAPSQRLQKQRPRSGWEIQSTQEPHVCSFSTVVYCLLQLQSYCSFLVIVHFIMMLKRCKTDFQNKCSYLFLSFLFQPETFQKSKSLQKRKESCQVRWTIV